MAADSPLAIALRGASAAGLSGNRDAAVVHLLRDEVGPDGLPRTLPIDLWPELIDRLERETNDPEADWSRQSLESLRDWLDLIDPGRGNGRLVDPETPIRHVGVDGRSFCSKAMPFAGFLGDPDERSPFALRLDHRRVDCPASLVWSHRNRPWLGPTWQFGLELQSKLLAAPRWRTSEHVDSLIWRIGNAEVVRNNMLAVVPNKNLVVCATWREWGIPRAIKSADPDRPPVPITMRLGLGATVVADRFASESGPVAEHALRLTRSDRSIVQAVSLQGSLALEAGADGPELVVHEHSEEPGGVAIAFSWSSPRHRSPLRRVRVSVAEAERLCLASEAWACRASWGRQHHIVYYGGSDPRPPLRSFLGYPTRCRMILASMDRQGVLVPWIALGPLSRSDPAH